MSPQDMAKQMAVVLNDRICRELMTCAEAAATSRDPYTNLFGKLIPKDTETVQEASDLPLRCEAVIDAGAPAGTFN